jgi:dTDP-4-amino-4,6-dideoxygalactose transaminase
MRFSNKGNYQYLSFLDLKIKNMIPFNKPFLTGKETQYIEQSVRSGKISGNGMFTQKCQQFFEQKYGFKKCLLTTSCTDALEMCAILADIQPGDEVIIPSYTFVSTALAFVRQGAKIVFADSQDNHPNINPDKIEALITSRTKAIVPVHYAGVACDMKKIMQIANKYNLLVIEDAAQAIDSFWKPSLSNLSEAKLLGSIGHLSAFSFHETKNIISGEGGMLGVNDARFILRAEIIWEKGTNRAEFFRGEVNKYGWVDTGSSFLPSEIVSAFLWAQIEHLEDIQAKRKQIWNTYFEKLLPLAKKRYFILPEIFEYASNNAHMFYLVCNSLEERTKLITYLKEKDILAVFHYLSLHQSEYYKEKHDGRVLKNTERFTDCLVRLPLFYELSLKEVEYICNMISEFYNQFATL